MRYFVAAILVCLAQLFIVTSIYHTALRAYGSYSYREETTIYTPDARVVTSEDGTKIYATAIGDRKNPTAMFVRGLGCSLVHFNKQFADPKLRRNVHMVRSDAFLCIEHGPLFGLN